MTAVLVAWLADLGRDDVTTAGGKGANLGELTAAGLPVPPGFVVTTEAYRRSLAVGGAVPAEVRAAVLTAYAELGPDDPPVAVRSSGTAEDQAEASFAGQHDTVLNVVGGDAVIRALTQCWASLQSGRAVSYRAQHGLDPAVDPDAVSLAVVVQQMVAAEAAGVMFTASPADGRRDRLLVSAAWGLGEAVVSGAVDTDDLVLGGDPLRVLSRHTATKAVRTRYADGGRTEEVEVEPDLRDAPVLDDAAAVELAELGRAAERHFGAPQDLEWARGPDGFAIVQSRPITALPKPEADPPTDWTVPHPRDLYVRASLVEQLPDPLSPLFAELIDPAVSVSLRAVMTELLGPRAVGPDDASLPTVNGYAYYRYRRGAMLRLTLMAPRALPVLLPHGKRSGIDRWRDRARPEYRSTTERWVQRDVGALTAAELVAGLSELTDAGARYYTAVQAIIPIAATAEILFTRAYRSLARRRTDPPATVFLLGADSAPIRSEQSIWDLAGWVRQRPGLAAWVGGHRSFELAAGSRRTAPPDGVEAADWSQWRSRLQQHLDVFGHTVFNLDLVNATAAEEPEPVLDALRFALTDAAPDPYRRQQQSRQRRDEATDALLGRLDPVRRRLLTRLLRLAQEVGPLREDALADVGLAWPRLRGLALELGHRLVAAGATDRPDDVFWLRTAEILGALAPDAAVGDLRRQVAEQRALWRGRRRATPPQLLPQRTAWELMRRWLPAAAEDQSGPTIKGIGASGGRVTAVARVLSGPADFGLLQPGEVLVASITTPAWTSLFSVAGAVVTDIGGPLSHSSIVAREYGIPAVLGTGAATRWVRTGQRITVDGDAGTVTLADPSDA